MANTNIITQINVISNYKSFWIDNDPIIPIGAAAYAKDAPELGLKVGTGLKWSQTESRFDVNSTTPPHAYIHAKGGRDPITPEMIGAATEDHTHPEFVTIEQELATKAPIIPQIQKDYNRTEIIIKDADYKVPDYMVGSDRIEVLLSGITAISGLDPNIASYYEVGEKDSLSTTIRFHQDIPTDVDILVQVR